MKEVILLNYGENTKQVEEQEKFNFLRELLVKMGVPVEDFWKSNDALTVEQKIKLRILLSNFQIQFLDDQDGHFKILVENERVAEYFKPTYILKRDISQPDRRKQIFLEMHVHYWTIFEKDEKEHA